MVVCLLAIPATADDAARKKFVEDCAKRFAEVKARLSEPLKVEIEKRHAEIEKRNAEVQRAKAWLGVVSEGEVSTGVDYVGKDPKTGKSFVRHSSEQVKKAAVDKATAQVSEAVGNLTEATSNLAEAKSKLKALPLPEITASALPAISELQAEAVGRLLFSGKVTKILDGQTAVVKSTRYSLRVESPTKGLADGAAFPFPGLWEVVGTKKYNSQTLFHVRPISLTDREIRQIWGR